MTKLSLGCLLLWPALATAQITLNQSSHVPQMGDTLRTETYSTTTSLYFSDGPHQIWTIPADTTTTRLSTTHVPPQQTVYGTVYPNATLASVLVGQDSVVTYHEITPTGVLTFGAYTPIAWVNYNDPLHWMTYPLAYQDVQTSTFTALSQAFILGRLFRFKRGGTLRVEAVGHGTLVLPTGTLNNVLKVRHIMNYNDTLLTQGQLVTVLRDTIESWYSALSPYAVASYSKQYAVTQTGVVRNGQDRVTYQDAAQLVAARKIQIPFEGLKVYPNPAAETLYIEGLPRDCQLRVTNVQGQLVQIVDHIQADTYALEVAELLPGMYWLTLQQGLVLRTALFVVGR